MSIGGRHGGVGQDRSTWLTLLFLVLGVLAPTACVLWFMNEAAKGQAEAARQSVTEAYRGQLRFIRERVDVYWESRAAALNQASSGEPAEFARLIRAGVADSIVMNTPIRPEELSPSAVAAQAKIRALVKTDKEAAIRAIGEYFGISQGKDQEGRLIGADERLLAIHLMLPGDGRRGPALQRLVAMLNDYEHVSMPSAQRLFLMSEVLSIAPKTSFPTYVAERLAEQFLEADDPRPGEPGLQPTRVPDLWRLVSKSGRVIGLYRKNTVIAAVRRSAGSTHFTAVAPGERAPGETIPAGTALPGWQIALQVIDPRLADDAGRHRMVSYLWAGYLVAAVMVITGLLAGGALRKQMRLASLKTDLVAAVSHELRTPVASMRVLVDSLLDEGKFEPVKTREYLQLIAGENLRLTRLIENFLTFSRIERNRRRMEFQEVEPAELIEPAARSVRERFVRAGCDFNVEIERGLATIHADPEAIVTVLVNLLDNACKYTRAGERVIRLRAYSETGHVVLAVEDNGIGIEPREQKRIFRRFYQVDRRLARETGGCGLGLSIVEFIVRAHGGEVRVKSEPGAGSTFSVCLPRVS